MKFRHEQSFLSILDVNPSPDHKKISISRFIDYLSDRATENGPDLFLVTVFTSLAIPFLILLVLEDIVTFPLSFSTSANPRLTKAPGGKLLPLVDFLFRPTTVALTFKPLIADWQSEYFEALGQARTIKARWISVRYRFAFACAFIKAMGLSKVLSIFKQISK